MDAFEDAWDVLVVIDAWREWVNAHLVPASPYLYLAVRDNLPQRRLRKTATGASLQLPFAEISRAEADGSLVALYEGAIHDLYTRWAEAHGHPSPPALP